MKDKKQVTWKYINKADIKLKDKKTTIVISIILGSFLLLAIIGGIIFFTHKQQITDYLYNPQAKLITDTVNLELGDMFNAMDYIDSTSLTPNINVQYPENELVNTNIVDTYNLVYISSNSVQSQELTLIVRVIDKIPPKLELKFGRLKLERGDATKSFNPENYIKSISDNYDKSEDLKLEYTQGVDWSKDTATIIYTLRDTSGNSTTAELNLEISNPKGPTKEELEELERQKQLEEERRKQEEEEKRRQEEQSKEEEIIKESSEEPVEEEIIDENQPYIKGVHDIKIPVNTSEQEFINQLLAGISGSGYVSVNYDTVDLATAGEYIVTFSSSDGVEKQCKVIVYE